MTRAVAAAKSLAAKPQFALRESKRLMNRTPGMTENLSVAQP